MLNSSASFCEWMKRGECVGLWMKRGESDRQTVHGVSCYYVDGRCVERSERGKREWRDFKGV